MLCACVCECVSVTQLNASPPLTPNTHPNGLISWLTGALSVDLHGVCCVACDTLSTLVCCDTFSVCRLDLSCIHASMEAPTCTHNMHMHTIVAPHVLHGALLCLDPLSCFACYVSPPHSSPHVSAVQVLTSLPGLLALHTHTHSLSLFLS